MNTKQEAKQPFFAYIPLNAAHVPHVLPTDYYQQFGGSPSGADLRKMSRTKTPTDDSDPKAEKKRKRKAKQ